MNTLPVVCGVAESRTVSFTLRILRRLSLVITSTTIVATGCQGQGPQNWMELASPDACFTHRDLCLKQELVNDAPLGPGVPQLSHHCPHSPGNWFAGSGRATATSNVFGDLTEVEVYCINVDRAELSGGLATWTDRAGNTIKMSFGAKLLAGFAYSPAPSAPLIGFAQFTGGTGKWAGTAGHAIFEGRQNGDGTATLVYHGSIYLPG